MDYLNPPEYCPDALATDVGWINPKNGELLISVKNLRQKIADRDQQIARVVAKKAEDDRSTTQKILDDLTAKTIAEPRVDDRSETQKILDAMSSAQNQLPREDIKSTTERVLERLTDVTINTSGGRDLQLNISDETKIKESFGGPPKEPAQVEQQPQKRGRGRPRKVKPEEKE